MNNQTFKDQLSAILDWWAPLVDWDNGGIVTYAHFFKKEESHAFRSPLMHLRQLYNYSVGYEHGCSQSEEIATHLYHSLYQVFPESSGALLISSSRRQPKLKIIDAYLNAYHAICLSRFARAFNHREAALLALKVYQQLDSLFTDGDLRQKGTWDIYNPETGEKSKKSDNAHIHRCEAALNIYRALKITAPDVLEQEQAYLQSQLKDLVEFFDQYISRPAAGYTVEKLQADCSPIEQSDFIHQSLAHGFEWLGFWLEIEAHCDLSLPFMPDRMRLLTTRTLENGLAPNGCFRNDYYPGLKKSPLHATFWPQVESILGALWARKCWGEQAFPLELSQRMMDFYQAHFFIPEHLGGGIMNSVSENGCPLSYSTGHPFKCDHHAVRMCEKALEFDLLSEVPK